MEKRSISVLTLYVSLSMYSIPTHGIYPVIHCITYIFYHTHFFLAWFYICHDEMDMKITKVVSFLLEQNSDATEDGPGQEAAMSAQKYCM